MRAEISPTDAAAIAEVNKKELDHAEPGAMTVAQEAVLAVHSEPIAADCHTQYHAYHNSGRRPLKVIDLIVLHATQGGSALSNARYFTQTNSGGSTQLVVDDNACYRCLGDNEIPWGAPGANYNGFHIEQCGYSAWLKTMWSKTHRRTLMRAAYKTAFHCKRYGIKVRWLSAANLKAGMRNGITTHAECTKAFGGTHTDPGAGWPRLLFMTMVRGYFAVIKVKQIA